MGRPPSNGGPSFRFLASEIAEMEACLQEANYAVPSREVVSSLAEKFSSSAERAGTFIVQPKQVWNWFQNRRFAQKAKSVKSPGKFPTPRDNSLPMRSVSNSVPIPAGRTGLDGNAPMEFEAKSARDGAWYDVASFISHRMFEIGDPEVQVRFTGFGAEEDEWINVSKNVRQRSLPCEASECVAVLPGDLILCFQEGKDQALYFDAHVLDAQRRRHDVRGCRCRFLVRYDHDQSEEIVPLRKVCRRPGSDYRLQLLHASKEQAVSQPKIVGSTALVSPAKDTENAKKQSAREGDTQELVMTTETTVMAGDGHSNAPTVDGALAVGVGPDSTAGSASS